MLPGSRGLSLNRPIAARGAFLLLSAPLLCVAQISGIVHDPSGAVVAQASVALEQLGANSQLTRATDAQGRFHFDQLTAGAYQLTVSHEGFEAFTQAVRLGDKAVELSIALKLEAVNTSVTVSSGTLRNSDPNYQALRKGQLQQLWRVNNLVLQRDVATFTFRSGSFSFLPPVLGRVAVAVFTGDGNLKLTPAFGLAARYMKSIAHAESADEDFSSLVVYFTDSTFNEITQHAERIDGSPKPLQSVLESDQSAVRRRTDRPISFLETQLGDDDVPNIEAQVLAQLYNGDTGGFRAFIRGKKHTSLRFILDPRGALPGLPAPEEVALLNYATQEDADGIWYLSHTAAEVAAGNASSSEDHRAIAPESYRMDVSVSGYANKLSAQCALRFRALRDGVRMVRFELLPDLEVSSVTFDGRPIPFIQEARHHDGSFYLQFPERLAGNGVHEVVFNYSGGEYVQDTSQRVFRIQPLRPWYPRIDAVSRALFDITFHVPRGMTAVSVGKLARRTRQGSQVLFEWASDAPLPPGGFNYGDYRLTQRNDPKTGFLIESYLSNSGGPALPPQSRIRAMPGASSDVALINARNSVELFEHWYGPLPYSRLGVVESLYVASLPGLIFLPAVTLGGVPAEAYGGLMTSRLARALDEALPAAASGQWWGGLIMPASFHETWLARGLADFSAALYDEGAGDEQSVRQHWVTSHDALMGQDEFGLKLRDAPPVWFGSMTDIHSTLPPTYGGRPPLLYNFVSNTLLPRKGGFIIHMLRQLMRDPQNGDRDFIAMMHDFTATYANRSASTEDFRATLEKHMKPAMIMDGSRNMQWFFDDWVYGIDIPSYRLEYTVAPDGGKAKVTGVLTQSGVSDSFKMRVRVYVRLGKKAVPVLYLSAEGNRSQRFVMTLPEEPKEVLLNAENDVLAERQEVHRVKTPTTQ